VPVVFVVVVMMLGATAVAAAAADAFPPDAADVDEQRLVLAEEERQTLGHRLLPHAVPAVDEHQRRRRRVHGPAEYIGGGNRGRERRTTIGSGSHRVVGDTGSAVCRIVRS
jgi:hypothetical protein